MEITGVRTYVLEATLDAGGFGWAQRVTDRRQTAICVIETDQGFEGVGEAFYFGGPASIAAAVIGRALAPLLIGEDPLATSVLWDRLYNWTRDQGQKGLTIAALSAVDVALWDLKGKALGVPVSTLLGGAYRPRARAYATGLYEPQGVASVVDALAEEARGYVRDGFQGMKLKIGYGIDTDVEYVAALRDAIGGDVHLMVDANHAYNAPEALRVARAIERYDVHWLEEPVPPEDVDGYVELRARSPVRIAGGECEYTRYGFRDLIARRAVDVLQPDLCAAGGFTELQKIVAMASAANLPVMPHVWGTNVGLAAALQLYAALPNFPERRDAPAPWFELDRSPHPLRDPVTVERFEPRDGWLEIPQRPGIGATLDREFVEAHAIGAG